jgi:Fe-S oxidoreductase
LAAEGNLPEVLFWVGCSGSFDARSQKIAKAFATLMDISGISFAILGNEEMCTGDPARRAGNEFLFQMLAQQNIQTLNGYGITRIVTICPHCFNILKNEYPDLGGTYEVIHHTQFLLKLIEEGRLKLDTSVRDVVTYHDSCYLGRMNGIYETPRQILQALGADLREMERSKKTGLCCGAGGAQMFKEEEPGIKRVNTERIEEVLETGASALIVNCPFCMTMLTDGMKEKEKQDSVKVYDISELILQHTLSGHA